MMIDTKAGARARAEITSELAISLQSIGPVRGRGAGGGGRQRASGPANERRAQSAAIDQCWPSGRPASRVGATKSGGRPARVCLALA